MTYSLGAKVGGMYFDGGTVLDHSGVVTALTPDTVTVTFKGGRVREYFLPATDFLAPLRRCTGCGALTILNHDAGNGGCGAPTIPVTD